MGESKFNATIDHVERLTLSSNGNPRFRVHLVGGDVLRTQSDASVNYGIENPGMIGFSVEITTSNGKITYIRPLHKGEHSERGRYVTDQVKLWLENDGPVLARARKVSAQDGFDGFVEFVTTWIRTAHETSTPAWHVREELAGNDYDRVNWIEIYKEIAEEN